MSKIDVFVLKHPQSPDLIEQKWFDDESVRMRTISCGSSICKADLSEAKDFWPNYASWNSALFETSVILTIWEHISQLTKAHYVAVLHSDITMHRSGKDATLLTWHTVNNMLDNGVPLGLTVHQGLAGGLRNTIAPVRLDYRPSNDPMFLNRFDNNISIWECIKKADQDLYDWALSTQPLMIYAHQFCCSISHFMQLGERLKAVASNMRLSDIGLWTPHVFERLVALNLARIGNGSNLCAAFLHHQSSAHDLYGCRGFRYYNTKGKND